MKIPKLDPSGRKQEYNQRNFEEISQIVHTWLFTDNVGHREMDRDILRLDPVSSRGWQSMNVLHCLGLKKEFKGIFFNADMKEAINQLKSNEQDFELIIELLENTSTEYSETLVESLYESSKFQDKDFEEHYKNRLAELENTDGRGTQTQSRKEQAILRARLLKSASEIKCAICHRTFPTNLVVAAHIKPRRKCSTSERKNPDIVMPICKVGCDDFFEKGYIIVDEKGVVQINEKIDCSPELKAILGKLAGKHCTHFNEKTADFFAYKRESFESE